MPPSTKRANMNAAKELRAFLKETGQPEDLQKYSIEQLVECVGHFYMRARTTDGQLRRGKKPWAALWGGIKRYSTSSSTSHELLKASLPIDEFLAIRIRSKLQCFDKKKWIKSLDNMQYHVFVWAFSPRVSIKTRAIVTYFWFPKDSNHLYKVAMS